MGDRDKTYSSAEIGALAHLYRGEVYRSTIWRTRLDATTNWSVVTLGVALSISYADPAASPAPLLLAGVLITLFLNLEARRYRYFNVWRARARFLETKFYAPMLTKEPYEDTIDWQSSLARDYLEPQYHISFLRAIGRRLRRNYIWIFLVQSLAYLGKILIHPTPIPSVDAFFYRMAIGPAPGWLILAFGAAFLALWASVTVYVWRLDQKKHGAGASSRSMG
ncbi:MAG: DUF2270 domain-containing protein [Pseudomonadota bacterium]